MFTEKDIEKVIQNLDSNKAHGHDIYPNNPKCFEKGCFTNKWKKANAVPVHKKNDKQLVKNYRPISLLLICGKVSERLIYFGEDISNFLSRMT